jgi:hypothetical protein
MAVVREAGFEDLEAVTALYRSAGWGPPTVAAWERLWTHNPALDPNGPPVSRGWVLEEGGKLVGFLLNLAQLYQLGGRTLRAATACSMVVPPESRGSSMQLAAAFARQANVDLLLNTTAAPQASKVFQFLKFQRIPQPEYDRSFYWVLREAGFLNAALRKKGFSPTVSRLGGTALAPFFWAAVRAGRRLPRSQGGRLTVKRLDGAAVGGEFDDLWRRKLAEGTRLTACRTAETLRWHFAPEGRVNPPFLLGAFDGGRLVGYLAAVRQDSDPLQLRRARVADIFVERDDPDTIRQLLAAAAAEARGDGAHMLEVIGYPGHVRRVFVESRPFELWNESWPFLYRAPDPELNRALASPDVWHACLYDGDGSL